MENEKILKLLSKYDIIWIAELKNNIDVHLPGFKCYRNAKRYANHGGLCVFIKYYLVDHIHMMRFDDDDGIWVNFSHIQNVIFSGYYVPPESSPYHKMSILSKINLRLAEFNKQCIIFGDFNAKIADFNSILTNNTYSYPIQSKKEKIINGDLLQAICKKNQLVILNNLKAEKETFIGDLTFRKKDKWISEIDFCVLHPTLLQRLIITV